MNFIEAHPHKRYIGNTGGVMKTKLLALLFMAMITPVPCKKTEIPSVGWIWTTLSNGDRCGKVEKRIRPGSIDPGNPKSAGVAEFFASADKDTESKRPRSFPAESMAL